MIELRFELPFPPSANRYWRTTKRGVTYVSDEARAYREIAGARLLELGIPRDGLDGSLALDLIAHAPDRRRYDISNRIKVVEDLLEHCGVVADDRFFDDVRIRRGFVTRGGLLRIVVRQLLASDRQERLAM